MRVLCVDDDEVMLALLRDLLAPLGHSVVTVRDGSLATATFRRAPSDVVFVDYLMPRVSGLEVVRSVKQQSPATFVVLLTAMSPETVSRLAGVHRADAVVQKPVRKADVERLLEKAARRRAAPT